VGIYSIAVRILGLWLLPAMILCGQIGDEDTDYSSWTKDTETTIDHLYHGGGVSPDMREYTFDAAYWKWYDGVLANASGPIKSRLFALLNDGLNNKMPERVAAGHVVVAIRLLSDTRNLTEEETQKVSKIAVDLDKAGLDNGLVRNAALTVYLESFLPKKNVPNREEVAIKALYSPNIYVRRAAADVLVKSGTEKGLQAAKDYLARPPPQKYLELALGEVKSVVMILEKRLHSPQAGTGVPDSPVAPSPPAASVKPNQ